jgi:hypothetical protein
MDIIEHCKELCYLHLDMMAGFTEGDMNTIYEKLLQTGKEVDHRVDLDLYIDHYYCHYFKM